MGATRTAILISLLCVLSSGEAAARQGPANSTLTFLINDKGAVTLDVSIVPPAAGAQPPAGYGLFLVAVPLGLNLKDKNLNAANMRIVPLRAEGSYALLAVVAPLSSGEVSFRLDDVARITETQGGSAALELDLGYADMPQPERDLLRLPSAVSAFDLKVSLPKVYDVKDIHVSHPALTRVSERVYALSHAQAPETRSSKVWISFPNPIKQVTETLKLIFITLLSCLAALVEFKLFKESDIKWPLGVAILSALILGLAFYFGYALAHVVEFSIFLAGFVPQVLVGLAASVYQLLASRYRADVVGYVTINGKTTHTAEVRLLRRVNGEMKGVSRMFVENGQYKFHVWLTHLWFRKEPQVYQIQVPPGAVRPQGQSEEFQVTEQRKEMPVIDIKSILDDPAAGQGAAGQHNQM